MLSQDGLTSCFKDNKHREIVCEGSFALGYNDTNFYVVITNFEMGLMVTNVTVHT